MIAYKFLRPDGTSVFTAFGWTLPDDEPGAWVDARVDPCRTGVHACRVADLPHWVAPALYEIELDGQIVHGASKLVAARGRLRRRLQAWDGALHDAYTRMCADRAHDLALSASPALKHWDVLIEPWVPQGPAALGFCAARIAEEISGPHGYRAERLRQAEWLVARLGL